MQFFLEHRLLISNKNARRGPVGKCCCDRALLITGQSQLQRIWSVAVRYQNFFKSGASSCDQCSKTVPRVLVKVGSFLQSLMKVRSSCCCRSEGSRIMQVLVLVSLIQLWAPGLAGSTTRRSIAGSLIQGAETVLTSAAEKVKDIPIVDQIFSHCVEPPLECPNKNITFWYYSRSTSDSPMQISLQHPDSLNGLPKNQSPWKILIHGYTKSKDEIPNPQLRLAYFKHGDYNLVSVDYEPLARDKCYIQAVHNVPLIAKCTAQMIDALIERELFKPEALHVIGFSLGAQVAGRLHEHLKHEKPYRVTGLDPASPLFDGIVRNNLGPDAAGFVDVIHTNALGKGKLERSGHVDFYVNGGLTQPGCRNSSESFSTCNHDRSPLYFAESINSPEGFWGIPCSSATKFFTGLCNTNDDKLVLMGEYVPLDARGEYYVQTTDKAPFALGKRAKVSLTV